MLQRFLPSTSTCALLAALLMAGFLATPDVHAQPASAPEASSNNAMKAEDAPRSVLVRPDPIGVKPVLEAHFEARGVAGLERGPSNVTRRGPAVNEDLTAGMSRRTTYYVVGGALATGLAVTAAVLLTGGGDDGGGEDGGLAAPPTRPN